MADQGRSRPKQPCTLRRPLELSRQLTEQDRQCATEAGFPRRTKNGSAHDGRDTPRVVTRFSRCTRGGSSFHDQVGDGGRKSANVRTRLDTANTRERRPFAKLRQKDAASTDASPNEQKGHQHAGHRELP
ncbi:hypothetical protein MTO96_011845 [Rhipicephalus appendiculatus]